jgi:SAM-dependent methyltransferase
VVDLDEYRRNSLESWERGAANWEAEREFVWDSTRHISERLVERLDAAEGDTVLELAAGTGETSFMLADRVGASGKVISSDFAAAMVDAARRRGEELGIDNVEFRVLDAEAMELADDSVDGVLCRFGYMLMADPAKALGETRRVLRAGGRVSFAVWGPPQDNLWAAIPAMTLVEAGHLPPPEPGAPSIFALNEPARITELVTGAGFGEPEIEQVPVEWPYQTPEVHWEKTMKLATPLAKVVGELDEDERESVRLTVAERVSQQLAEGQIGGLVHVVVASE